MPFDPSFDTDFAYGVVHHKYMKSHGETRWSQTSERVIGTVMEPALAALRTTQGQEARDLLLTLMSDRAFMPGGRYLYATGNDFHQTQNCLLLRAEDSREGWADLSWKAEMALLTGAGIGVYYGDIRANGTPVGRTGGVASGPVPKMVAVNELGRAAVQGGDRRSAIWAGLLWSHPDIFNFLTVKDWPDYIKAAKNEDPSIPAPLDMTNVSVCLDDDFFACFDSYEYGAHLATIVPVPDGSESWHTWAQKVYWTAVEHMVQHGEPGFSIDLGTKSNEKLRNACTEIVSEDDSDICNLGGLVLPRYDSPAAFGEAVRLGTLFLLAGTLYSDVPYEKVAEVRDKNRRLGLDLLGVHEFLLQRGLRYGDPSGDDQAALEPYMREYDRALDYSWDWADKMGISRPVAATSGAPTGTRGIAAETTTSWEPVMAVAYGRSVITSKAHERDTRETTYVVDPTVARLVREGYIRPDEKVDDAMSLAYDVERRLRMQAYAQSHTDQAISMTINLPHVMTTRTEQKQFGDLLYRYLPSLRGITVYPNGARAGQPITPVPLRQALVANNLVIEDEAERCASGVCGV